MSISAGNNISAKSDLIIAKICSCGGCKRDPSLDTSSAYCFVYRETNVFFVPHPLRGDYYTVDQVAEIEKALNGYELELLPLDPNLLTEKNA